MKKFYESTKSKLLLLVIALLVTSFGVMAAPVARVQSITGNAFVLVDGRTQMLEPGMNLDDYSELITEEGSQVVFTDYFDHRFYLSGSGHVKLLNRITELRSGYLWIQSYNESDQFTVQTANAKVEYTGGEAVISFDDVTTRSQLLVVKGRFIFGNLLQDYMVTPVREGQFSFIQNEYENGSPRNATSIGEESFGKVTSLFRDIKPMESKDRALELMQEDPSEKVATGFVVKGRAVASRSIASVAPQKNPGDIVYVQKAPEVAVKSNFAIEDYHRQKLEAAQKKMTKVKKIKKPFAPDYSTRSNVQVVIYGASTATKRAPASVAPKKAKVVAKRAPASIVPKPEIKNDTFESSLVDQYKKQLRHSEETNQLIQELKNFDQDYKANY